MKNRWRASEVLAFLEDKIAANTATQDETTLYENYQWSGKLDKTNYALKLVIREMNNEYAGV